MEEKAFTLEEAEKLVQSLTEEEKIRLRAFLKQLLQKHEPFQTQQE